MATGRWCWNDHVAWSLLLGCLSIAQGLQVFANHSLGEVLEYNFTESVEAELEELGLELARLNHTGVAFHKRRDNKPMIWVHVHKSGGSTMCKLAWLNNESVVRPNLGGCHWLSHDLFYDANIFKLGVYNGFGPPAPACGERLEHFRSGGYTWGQVERTFAKEDFCPESFRYGIMLRDPLQMAHSMVNFLEFPVVPYHGVVYKDVLHCLEGSQSLSTPANESLCGPLSHEYDIRLWMFFDNFLVRTLGGPGVYALPPGGVTASHADEVIRLLQRFDVVISLEDVADDRTGAIFAKKLSWGYGAVPRAQAKGTGSLLSQGSDGITFTADEALLVQQRNKHDHTVYNYFTSREGQSRR